MLQSDPCKLELKPPQSRVLLYYHGAMPHVRWPSANPSAGGRETLTENAPNFPLAPFGRTQAILPLPPKIQAQVDRDVSMDHLGRFSSSSASLVTQMDYL